MLRRCVLILMFIYTPALAMNWEGHEDGPSRNPYDEMLRMAVPEAQPLPSPDCPVTAEMVRENPYEQIPLPRHRCPPASDKPESKR
ncbi:MAG: hypothetical protein KDK75_07240 [Alphaproteobacteria bacterium]|nr:hypothetical protein [Alphaproteobacteria bacterium]